jgi:hypothetical protein
MTSMHEICVMARRAMVLRGMSQSVHLVTTGKDRSTRFDVVLTAGFSKRVITLGEGLVFVCYHRQTSKSVSGKAVTLH